MKVFQTLEGQQRQSLLILFTVGLLFWSSLTSLSPTLPQYIEDVGGTKQQVGLVMGCFAIGLLLFRNPLGRMADLRSRKLVVIIGTIAVALAPLGYLFTQSISLLMLVRMFHGISIAAFTIGYLALVTDLSPVDKRGELIGYMSLATPIGLGLGPALGGFLQQEVSYTVLFLVSAALGGLGVLLGSQIREPIRHAKQKPRKSESWLNSSWQLLVKLWELLSSPPLGIPALVMLLFGIVFGTKVSFVSLFIRETGINLNPGLFFTATAIASFVIRALTGQASDRYGRGVFITASVVCYIISMLMISQAETGVGFLLAGLLEGAGTGLFIPMMTALMADRSSADQRGQVFAVCISGFDLGIGLAGPIFGYFADLLGYRGIFSCGAGIAFLALIIFMTQSNKNLSRSLRFAIGRERDLYAVDTIMS
ncbi:MULTISPECIES: MFS transporter [Moorena]|uniref:Arabinose efflux permease n=1 Tax=Moorena producens 3L TaxID=489825 RepID=F4XPL1_9CYAN|nr:MULTISPECIES: MFS transporter [Moorena]EGJ33465.1 arabinose efflux permease [Moorena producens 3L]NEP30567.1 MFS transporter [Moorena sp. SIO3B2]NEP65246.1 MFS transporter [Moorena sp. SIO3A5]NER87247.1 MFS transporter [Moorena sp. SIO3A2]NES43083.1 MFS transporter [Moorena sp. SIO2C4]